MFRPGAGGEMRVLSTCHRFSLNIYRLNWILSGQQTVEPPTETENWHSKLPALQDQNELAWLLKTQPINTFLSGALCALLKYVNIFSRI